MKVQPVGNTARSTIFFHDNASPTGMRDRSKVKKTVPAQGTLCAIYREHPDRATLTSQR